MRPMRSTKRETLRGRIVVTVQDKKDFVDVLHGRNHQLYGIIEADLRPDTTLTVGAHYRKTDNDGVATGVVTAADGRFLNLPRSTYLGSDFDDWRQTDKTIFAELEHRFANGWKAKLAATRKTPEIDTDVFRHQPPWRHPALQFAKLPRRAGQHQL